LVSQKLADRLYEIRWISINYPGSGNNSQFTYDGLGRDVQILEHSGGSLTNTKQLVWSATGFSFRECRNAAGTITAQFFARGETISATSYFYTNDHLGALTYIRPGFTQRPPIKEGFNPVDTCGSVREMTDSSGNIKAQYAYGPFGLVTTLQNIVNSDLQYSGYYNHAPSGLALILNRDYSAYDGRFNTRDPLGEKLQLNPYAYVGNNPITKTDPSGLGCCPDGADHCTHPADMPWPPDSLCSDCGTGNFKTGGACIFKRLPNGQWVGWKMDDIPIPCEWHPYPQNR